MKNEGRIKKLPRQEFVAGREQAEDEQRVWAEALRDVTALLNSNLDFEDVLDSILTHVARVVPYDAGTIMLIKGDVAQVTRARGYDESILGMRLAFKDAPNLRQIIQTGRPSVIADTHASEVWVASPETNWIRSSLAVAIDGDGQTIGLLSLERDTPDAFTPEHVERLQAFANQVGVAIRNAHLFQAHQQRINELERQQRQLAELLRVSNLLQADLALDEMLTQVAWAIHTTIGFNVVLISLVEQSDGDAPALVQRVAGAGLPPEDLARFRASPYPLPELTQALRDEFRISQSYYIPCEERWKLTGRYYHERGRCAEVEERIPGHWHSQDFWLVPFYDREGQLIGQVAVDGPADGLQPTRESIEMLELFTNQAATAVINAQLLKGEVALRQDISRHAVLLEQSAAELDTVNRISQALASELDLDALIQLVGEQMRQTFSADIVYVALLDQQTGLIHFPYQVGENITTIKLGEGLTSQIIETGQSFLINKDIAGRHAELGVDMLGVEPQSYLGVPITVGQQTIGVISVQSVQETGRFGEDDLRLLSTIAANVSTAIQNAQLYQETQRRAGEMAALFRLSAELAATLDEAEVCRRVVDGLRDTLGYGYLGLFLLDEISRDRVAVAIAGRPDVPANWRLAPGQGLSERPLLDGKLHYTPDVTRDPRHVSGLGTEGAEVDVPIRIGGQVLGVLIAESVQPHAFTQDDFEVLTAAANQAGLAIGKARLLAAERRRADELDALRATMANIISFLPDATMVIDRESKVIAWNRAIEELTGIKAKDMLGKGDYEYAIPFYGERRPVLIDLVLLPDQEFEKKYAHIEKRGSVLVGETSIPRMMGGSEVYLVGTASALRDSKGHVVGAIESIRDVTAHKRTEEALRRAKEAAEAANESKSAFVANVSHELRTPLTSILGFAKVIKKRLDQRLFPLVTTRDRKTRRAMRHTAEEIDVIISEGERLTTLINNVLDLAKIEAGKIEWRMQPQVISKVIERATTATSALFEQKGLKLIKDIEDGLPEVMGDQDRLIQVMINLLSNAVKFTDEGAVTCQARQTNGEVLISVIDTGVGIARADQAAVFEKFTQVSETPTGKPQGTGLGLPICKQIVEHHGGRIWMEGEPGRGSAFTFTLPIQGDD